LDNLAIPVPAVLFNPASWVTLGALALFVILLVRAAKGASRYFAANLFLIIGLWLTLTSCFMQPMGDNPYGKDALGIIGVGIIIMAGLFAIQAANRGAPPPRITEDELTEEEAMAVGLMTGTMIGSSMQNHHRPPRH
jgi:energy-coupling factor transporter transmembrane protein EcfT